MTYKQFTDTFGVPEKARSTSVPPPTTRAPSVDRNLGKGGGKGGGKDKGKGKAQAKAKARQV